MGLLVSMIARPTTAEAMDAAGTLVDSLAATSPTTQRDFVARSDSVAFTGTYARATTGGDGWLGPCLWNGAVPYLGAPAIALVGSAEEVASAILDYERTGISQFLFMGWPDIDEMSFFSQAVVPLVRARERCDGAALTARSLSRGAPRSSARRVTVTIMLRFHWRLPQGGERPRASRAHQASLAETGLPDLDVQMPFARAAEASGIDSLLPISDGRSPIRSCWPPPSACHHDDPLHHRASIGADVAHHLRPAAEHAVDADQ